MRGIRRQKGGSWSRLEAEDYSRESMVSARVVSKKLEEGLEAGAEIRGGRREGVEAAPGAEQEGVQGYLVEFGV